jgi:hypothetical protein
MHDDRLCDRLTAPGEVAVILRQSPTSLSLRAEFRHRVEVAEPVPARPLPKLEPAVVEEFDRVVAHPPVEAVRSERCERHRVFPLLLAEAEVLGDARVHGPD